MSNIMNKNYILGFFMFALFFLSNNAFGQSMCGIVNENQTVQASEGNFVGLATDNKGNVYATFATLEEIQVATTDAGWVTTAAIAEGSITSSYTTALTNTEPIRVLDFYNGTDADLYISFNASTNHLVLPASTGKILDLGASGLHVDSNVSVKYVSNPSGGTLYVSGAYKD